MLCLGQLMPATLSTAHNDLNPIPTCIPWSAPRGATQCPHTISTIRPKHNASAGQMQGQNWTHTCLLGSTWVLCPPMPNSSASHQTRQGPVHPQQVPEPAAPPNLKSWNAAKARLPLLAQHHTSHHTKCNNVTNLNIFCIQIGGMFWTQTTQPHKHLQKKNALHPNVFKPQITSAVSFSFNKHKQTMPRGLSNASSPPEAQSPCACVIASLRTWAAKLLPILHSLCNTFECQNQGSCLTNNEALFKVTNLLVQTT